MSSCAISLRKVQFRVAALVYQVSIMHNDSSITVTVSHVNYSKATKNHQSVIWCSMHSSSELNSSEDTSILSSEKNFISVKTFYTVTSWQTTTAQGIRSL